MMYTLKYSKPREVNYKTGLTLEEYERAEKGLDTLNNDPLIIINGEGQEI